MKAFTEAISTILIGVIMSLMLVYCFNISPTYNRPVAVERVFK